MNDENLIPTSKRSKDEARALGKKGGIASGKARRQKADLRKAMQEALETKFKDSNGKEATGLEIAITGILTNLSDPNSRNWGKALEMMALLTGNSLTKDQVAKIKADTALTKAKTKAIEKDGGSMADIEDLTPLAEMLKGDDHDEDADN